MNRREKILEKVAPGSKGIEIGPWFAPLAPKRDGWKTLVLDVFPLETLRERAKHDSDASRAGIAGIEDVDLLGSATELDSLVSAAGQALGSFDFVISSHNFEHLPDPLRFLQAVERVLKAGGVLSMAMPDRRCSFDHLRPESSLGQVLEAALTARQQPSPVQVFDFQTSKALRQMPGGAVSEYFPLEGFQDSVLARGGLQAAYAQLKERLAASSPEYVDAHCWAFTPASLQLLLAELRLLGLLSLQTEKVWPTEGVEFVIHLRKPLQAGAPAPDSAPLLEALLAERAATHLAWQGHWTQLLRRGASGFFKGLGYRLRHLLGKS